MHFESRQMPTHLQWDKAAKSSSSPALAACAPSCASVFAAGGAGCTRSILWRSHRSISLIVSAAGWVGVWLWISVEEITASMGSSACPEISVVGETIKCWAFGLCCAGVAKQCHQPRLLRSGGPVRLARQKLSVRSEKKVLRYKKCLVSVLRKCRWVSRLKFCSRREPIVLEYKRCFYIVFVSRLPIKVTSSGGPVNLTRLLPSWGRQRRIQQGSTRAAPHLFRRRWKCLTTSVLQRKVQVECSLAVHFHFPVIFFLLSFFRSLPCPPPSPAFFCFVCFLCYFSLFLSTTTLHFFPSITYSPTH